MYVSYLGSYICAGRNNIFLSSSFFVHMHEMLNSFYTGVTSKIISHNYTTSFKQGRFKEVIAVSQAGFGI